MNAPVSQASITPVAEAMADGMNHAAAQGGDMVRQLAAKAERSVDQWRGQAEVWRDGTTEHIRAHPVRSVLIAAGTGMALALLVRAFSR